MNDYATYFHDTVHIPECDVCHTVDLTAERTVKKQSNKYGNYRVAYYRCPECLTLVYQMTANVKYLKYGG